MLKIVHSVKPSPKEAVIERVKMQREDCTLQCNRCGCRTSITAVTGAIVKNGRVQGGTATAKHECAECWKRGIYSPMLPELKPAK
ncbi:MAG: hypothetical protein WA191_06860 [Telluria sp.]